MANALQQQMADGIASLVKKQTFAGSGVWRQSGNATLRIETQTNSLLEALSRIPSLETQEEEERESDRQHEELIDAIEGTSTQTTKTTEKKGGGLFGGISSLFKGLGKIGTLGLGFGALGLKGILKGFGFILRALRFVGGPLLALGTVAFLSKKPEEREQLIKDVVGFFTSIGDTLTKLKNAFVDGLNTGEELDTEGLKTSWTNFTNSVAQFLGLIEFDLLGEKYKGAEGVARAMGVLTKELSDRIVEFAKGVLDFLADPGKGLGEFKGTIKSAFEIMGKNISNVLTDVFSIEGMIRMLESAGLGMLIPDSVYKKADEQRKERSLSRMSESFTQQAKQQKIIEKNQQKLKTIPVTDVFKRRDVQAKITKAQDMLKFYKEEDASAQQSFEAPPLQPLETQDFSYGLGSILLRLNDIVLGRPFNATQQIIGDALLPDVPVSQMERPAISQTVDDILSYLGINTGENLNQLQVARTTGGTTGSTGTVIVDQSQQPTIINQNIINSPQPNGPALVGERRDKLN